jgi:FkbM family methyltransferase
MYQTKGNLMKTVTAKNKYGTYCIPEASKHRASSRKLLKGMVWEPETINFIRKYCNHDLIHAGAYFGDMLPAFSKLDKVWAFEPSELNYKCALKTIEMNGLTNIHLMNVALGEESKPDANLMIARDGKVLGGGCKVIDRGPQAKNQELGKMGKTHKTTKVPMVTIDETIPTDREISVIHLDVELYELLVLRGGIETIKRCSPYLILETHRSNPELKEFLTNLSYKRYTKEKTHRENSVWKREK